MKHTKHNHHVAYATTVGESIYSIFIGPIAVIAGLFILLKLLSITEIQIKDINFFDLFLGASYTLARLLSAYFLALIVAIPLSLIAVRNSITEKIFLPLFDVLESIPILAFFPVLVLFFLNIDFANGAAIFILFLSMLWNLVFTVVGGLKIIPRDITYVAKVFGIKGFKYFRQITLPSIFPEILTGSILALAQGWNLIIVAEVLHTYVPAGSNSQDLLGIGSILVNASATGQTNLFIACISVMIIVIALFNYFIWQNLIHYAEKFKFE